MKYLAMIQARCGSSRLPNKVMKDLCGKPMLQRMIERVKKSKKIDELMVVTSIEKANLSILRLCADIDTRVGIGSEEDVLDRFYQCAKLLNPEYVIRLTADCPCFDAGLLDEIIENTFDGVDYCGMITESFADGLDLEIIKFSALKKAWEEADHSSEREHVTPYIRNHPELFSIKNIESPIGYFGNYRWTVDCPEDFELVENIYSHFMDTEIGDNFSYVDILNYMKQFPELANINNAYDRNEGFAKSIKEDHIVIFDK